MNATAPVAMPDGNLGRTQRRSDGTGRRRRPGHVDARGAARALSIIRPQTAIPIHRSSFGPIGLLVRTRRCHDARPVVPVVEVQALGPDGLPGLRETPRDVDGDGLPGVKQRDMGEPLPVLPDLGSEPNA